MGLNAVIQGDTETKNSWLLNLTSSWQNLILVDKFGNRVVKLSAGDTMLSRTFYPM